MIILFLPDFFFYTTESITIFFLSKVSDKIIVCECKKKNWWLLAALTTEMWCNIDALRFITRCRFVLIKLIFGNLAVKSHTRVATRGPVSCSFTIYLRSQVFHDWIVHESRERSLIALTESLKILLLKISFKAKNNNNNKRKLSLTRTQLF